MYLRSRGSSLQGSQDLAENLVYNASKVSGVNLFGRNSAHEHYRGGTMPANKPRRGKNNAPVKGEHSSATYILPINLKYSTFIEYRLLDVCCGLYRSHPDREHVHVCLPIYSKTRRVLDATALVAETTEVRTSNRDPSRPTLCCASLGETSETFTTSYCRFFAPSQVQNCNPRTTYQVSRGRPTPEALLYAICFSCCLWRVMSRRNIPFPPGVSPDWSSLPEFNRLVMEKTSLVRSKAIFEGGPGKQHGAGGNEGARVLVLSR